MLSVVFSLWTGSEIKRPLVLPFRVVGPEILFYEDLCAKRECFAFIASEISDLPDKQQGERLSFDSFENWHSEFLEFGSEFYIARNTYFWRSVEFRGWQFYVSRHIAREQEVPKPNFRLL